jgi:hypothetical protein
LIFGNLLVIIYIMIESGRPPLGAVGLHIFEAPPADGGSGDGGNGDEGIGSSGHRRFRLGRLLSRNIDPPSDLTDETELPPEEAIVEEVLLTNEGLGLD